MSLVVRLGIASIDAMLASVRTKHAQADVVVMSWERKHRSLGVMGLADDAGNAIDARPDVLSRLTGLLHSPMHPDVLRLAYPDADLALSGQVVLNVPVDEPTWARALTNVELRVAAGLRVPTEDICDAVWVTLEAAGVPSGSVTLDRQVMFQELPDDVVFIPAWLSTHQGGAGESVGWQDAVRQFAHPSIAAALTTLLNELAVRDEREKIASSGEKLVITRSVVSL